MHLSRRILVVDDEPGLRQTFTHILKRAGGEATSAATGAEALERLAASTYDLAYLDLRMPGLSGLDLLKAIHARYPTLPVVLFTAYASLESAMEAVRLGATDYLLKPINPETLLARTRGILEAQAVERRKRELRAQIENLQAELKSLEAPATPLAPPRPSPDRFLKRGQLMLDLQSRRVTLSERVVTVPPAAFDYLVVLTRHAPDSVDYQTLVSEAQGYQTDRRGAQELAKWHIYELHSALETDPRQPHYILNLRGVGYRLVMD